MKFILRWSVVLVTTASFMISSCEKKFLDARNKYTGDYDLTLYTSTWQLNQPPSDTVIHISGKVFYDKQMKHQIIIRFNNTDLKTGIDRKGKLTLCNASIGSFQDRKHFYVHYGSNTCGGGMGGGSESTILGTKK